MTTVRELIDQLFKVENLDEPVIFEYYLKEHFHITRKDNEFIKFVDVDDKMWSEAVEAHDDILVNDKAYTKIRKALERASA